MKRLMIILFILGILAAIILALVLVTRLKKSEPMVYGATFSSVYAEELGLDWQGTFLAARDTLQIQHFRIPVYWNRIEAERGVYDFSEIDWLMDRTAEKGGDVVLVVGMKVPRWPECFVPEWAEDLSVEERQQEVEEFMTATVERYKDHPALLRWQVENEPFFPFGECPKREKGFYKGEVALVRTLDPNHETQVTTSGEQSLWVLYADGSDVVGSSLYRTVYVPVIGYFTFPIPSFIYTFQAQLVELLGKRVVISELQMEPWLPPNNDELSIDERAALFSPKDMQKNIQYAEKTRISEVYVWGIEWWYYLHLNQHSDLWDAGKDIFIMEEYENI